MNKKEQKPLYSRFGINFIYYDSQQNKTFMVLTAKQAKEISIQYSASGKELEDILAKIKSKAEVGELQCKVYGISDKTRSELIQLGFSVKADQLTTASLIYWENTESAFDINKMWADKILSDPAQNELLKKEIWPESEQQNVHKENTLIQEEMWKKSQREKAKYEALDLAAKIHEQTGYTSPGIKAVEELTETFGEIYKLLIADLDSK